MIHLNHVNGEGEDARADETSRSLFSYVDLEERIPARHPLRRIRWVANDALAHLESKLKALCPVFGCASI